MGRQPGDGELGARPEFQGDTEVVPSLPLLTCGRLLSPVLWEQEQGDLWPSGRDACSSVLSPGVGPVGVGAL